MPDLPFIGGLQEWLKRRQQAQGLTPPPAPAAIWETPGTPGVSAGAAGTSPAPTGPPPGYDPYDPTLPFPADTKDTLERWYNELKNNENEQHRLQQITGNTTLSRATRDEAQTKLDAQRVAERATLDKIGAEENRRADNARADAAAKTAEERRKETEAEKKATRVAEGTQSWELKELNGVWYQVPTRARADGSWEMDTSRTPQRASGFPGAEKKVEVYDGIPYTRDGDKLTPVAGYVKPPMFRTDATGKGYTSTDNGVTWTPAAGLPGTAQTVTANGTVYPLDEHGLPITDRGVRLPPGEQTQVVEGYLVRADPATGQVTRTDLYTPEQRARMDQTAGITLATAQQNLQNAQRLQDPFAEYQRQMGVAQQTATQQRDALNDKVLRGELSVEDAQKQFDSWWETNVEATLDPYRTMAEGAYRKEQTEYDIRQAAERARVEAINRQREQLGYQAGETARNELNALAPSARSPEFLAQLAQNVSNIGKPLPGGPSQHHGGMQFSPESLSLANVRRAMPNLTEVGQNAAARALAQISPAAAQAIGAPPPQVPGLPQFQDYMRTAPFTIPNPALPLPGEAALDLGNPANATRLGLPVQPGYAGTRYQGGRVEGPWQIPPA